MANIKRTENTPLSLAILVAYKLQSFVVNDCRTKTSEIVQG